MRVGSVGFATEQGIAHLMKWFFDHGVIDDVMVCRHGKRPTHLDWYPPGTIELVGRPFTGRDVDIFLDSVDVMLFFESPLDWELIARCRTRGVKTVVVPMYEWTPVKRPHEPDAWLCPSKLDCEYFPGSPFVPIPVENPYRECPKCENGIVLQSPFWSDGPTQSCPGCDGTGKVLSGRWNQRTTAKTFLHNAGNVGVNWHKGTLEILKAWEFVKSDATLHVRAQDTAEFGKILSRVPQVREDKRVTIELGGVPYSDLFASHDVFLMAEKYNGLSLPIQEARAAGMVVVTSDRFPMNDWLPKEYLIPVSSVKPYRNSGAYYSVTESVIDPRDIAATVDRIYGQDVTEYSRSGLVWAEQNSWDVLKPVWLDHLRRVVGK